MIEGKLVNLRALALADAERIARWRDDREVGQYGARRYVVSPATEEAALREYTTQPMRFDAGPWFAIDTKDGRHIGFCELVASPEDRKATLGVMIGERDCWDQGYGTDAVSTLVRFGFDEMNLHRIALTVFAAHGRAVAVYKRCGFVEEGRLREAVYRDGAYHDVVHMALLRDEFESRMEAAREEVAR
jgi:RimJ/RimL family protein N-acetyltransferase